jgi:hypothetical protein
MGNRRIARQEDGAARDERPGPSGLADIQGDPGAGGLLADPQAPVAPRVQRGHAAGLTSPDPELPKAHGDWLPTHKSRIRPTH